MKRFKRLVNDEAGQDLLEYALLVALIALIAIAVVGLAGSSVQHVWHSIVGLFR